MHIRLLQASETAYFPRISDAKNLSELCIEGTDTLLLEMPFSAWQDFEVEEVLSLKLDRGILPILVHPERFCFLRENVRKLERLMEYSVGVQINASSVNGIWRRKTAFDILRKAPLSVLGSDCHDLNRRPPDLQSARKTIRKHFGPEFLNDMDSAAEAIIAGRMEKGE